MQGWSDAARHQNDFTALGKGLAAIFGKPAFLVEGNVRGEGIAGAA